MADLPFAPPPIGPLRDLDREKVLGEAEAERLLKEQQDAWKAAVGYPTAAPKPASLSVVALKPSDASMAEALSIVDQLRDEIASGRAIGFAAATVSERDDVRAWTGTVKRVSRLRIMGAVSYLLACLHSGDA